MWRVNTYHAPSWTNQIEKTSGPTLTDTILVNDLLTQLCGETPLPASSREREALLLKLVKENAYLIIVDNLETVADYKNLLPLLRRLANPGKILLISRYSLSGHSDVFSINVDELGTDDAVTFLKHEAGARGLHTLANAAQTEFEAIYRVVGGNPLALKLVVGQLSALPLSQVLKNLRKAQVKKAQELYAYIYWQSWHALSPESKQAFLVMPLVGFEGRTLA